MNKHSLTGCIESIYSYLYWGITKAGFKDEPAFAREDRGHKGCAHLVRLLVINVDFGDPPTIQNITGRVESEPQTDILVNV